MISALIGRLAGAHLNHRRIASGAALIGLLMVVAKLFVAAREMAIAWRYGISATVDAYQLALTITTWLPMMLAGVIALVLVPRLVALRDRPPDRVQLVGELNGSVMVLGIGLAALTWLAAPAASVLLTSGGNAETARLTQMMARQMAPIALFMVMAGYLSARLQARERFAYSVTEAIPAFAIALLVLLPLGRSGPMALIAGTLIGYLLQLLVLGGMTHKSDPPLGAMRLRHRSAEWRSLYGGVLLMGLGQLLITATIPIDQGFAARLGEGSVATLGYANRIVTLFSGLATIVAGRALLPVLSGAIADGDLALGRRHALQWSIFLCAGATIGSVILWAVTPEIVRLLFQRGAFTSAASAEVTSVLRWGLIQLPFYFAGIGLVQWYAATGRFRALLMVTVVALTFKIPLNAILAPRLGVQGIMVSTAAMYFVTFTMLVALLGKSDVRAGLPAAERGR